MIRDILQFPMPPVNKQMNQKLGELVENLLSLYSTRQATTLHEKIEQLNQRIAYTDEKINKLVYELYGLSDEEIGIVEGRK